MQLFQVLLKTTVYGLSNAIIVIHTFTTVIWLYVISNRTKISNFLFYPFISYYYND